MEVAATIGVGNKPPAPPKPSSFCQVAQVCTDLAPTSRPTHAAQGPTLNQPIHQDAGAQPGRELVSATDEIQVGGMEHVSSPSACGWCCLSGITLSNYPSAVCLPQRGR